MFIPQIKYIMHDFHLVEQHEILYYYNEDKIKHFINIDNKNDVIMLEKLINQNINKLNKSNDDSKNILKKFILMKENKFFYDIICDTYKNDYIFFKKYNIDLHTL